MRFADPGDGGVPTTPAQRCIDQDRWSLQAFDGDDFEVGIGPMRTTFRVSSPPRKIDGTWRMTSMALTDQGGTALKMHGMGRGVRTVLSRIRYRVARDRLDSQHFASVTEAALGSRSASEPSRLDRHFSCIDRLTRELAGDHQMKSTSKGFRALCWVSFACLAGLRRVRSVDLRLFGLCRFRCKSRQRLHYRPGQRCRVRLRVTASGRLTRK